MDIYLYTYNRAEVIKFPAIPSKVKIKRIQQNEVFDTINLGELKTIGPLGLYTLTLESFFPTKDYDFIKDTTYKGIEYAKKIETWRETRMPLRLIVTDIDINIPICIDDFEYGPEDGSGDIYYTMSISEFKVV